MINYVYSAYNILSLDVPALLTHSFYAVSPAPNYKCMRRPPSAAVLRNDSTDI